MPTGGSTFDIFLNFFDLIAYFFFIGGFRKCFPSSDHNPRPDIGWMNGYRTSSKLLCCNILLHTHICKRFYIAYQTLHMHKGISVSCHFLHAYSHFIKPTLHLIPSLLLTSNSFTFRMISLQEPRIHLCFLNNTNNCTTKSMIPSLCSFSLAFILNICYVLSS